MKTHKLSYTLDETCAAIGIGKTKCYQFLDSGALPAKKIGKRTIILGADLEEFLSNLEAYSTQRGA